MQACLNGYRFPWRHPALPVTAAQLAADAQRVAELGAGARRQSRGISATGMEDELGRARGYGAGVGWPYVCSMNALDRVVGLRRAGVRPVARVQALEETELTDDAAVTHWLHEL